MGKVLTDLVFRLSSDVAELKSGLGQANKEMRGFKSQAINIGKGLGALFAADKVIQWGTALAQASKKLLDLKAAIRDTTNASIQDLDDLTGQISAMASQYETSTDNILTAAKSLSRETGISFAESTDLISQGMAVAGEKSGEFLDQVKEYPSQFSKMGISAEKTIGIISQSISTGIFSDKGADTIKEVGLRLGEMTVTTADALEGIGISSDVLQEGIENGSISMEQAIIQISTEIGKLPATSNEVGTAIADIFGGAGEDAGLKFIVGLKDGFTDITEFIADKPLAEAKVAYTEAAAGLSSVWASFLGEDAQWWIDFKTGALEFATEFVKIFPNATREVNEAIKAAEEGLNSLNKVERNNKIAQLNNDAEALKFQIEGVNDELQKADFSSSRGASTYYQTLRDQLEELENQVTILEAQKEILNSIQVTENQILADKKAQEEIDIRIEESKRKQAEHVKNIKDFTNSTEDLKLNIAIQEQETKDLAEEIEDYYKVNPIELSLKVGDEELSNLSNKIQGYIAGQSGTGDLSNNPNEGLNIPTSPTGLVAEAPDSIKLPLIDNTQSDTYATLIDFMKTKNEEFISSIESMGATTQSMINTLSNIDWGKNWDQGIASLLAGLAQLIPQIATAVASLSALFAAKAVSGAAALPFPASLAAMASALATAISIGGAIKGMFSKKAIGGLAEGLTLVGETGPELVQFGQTARVYNANNTKGLLASNGDNSEVRFKIEGETLVGVLSNVNTKNNVFG